MWGGATTHKGQGQVLYEGGLHGGDIRGQTRAIIIKKGGARPRIFWRHNFLCPRWLFLTKQEVFQ